jgi:Trk K+ transport system NAD-binding subunit
MPDAPPTSPFVLIIGYGMPGRAVAELARDRGVELAVIELNESTVHRCEGAGPRMIAGDARDPQVLQSADVQRASLIVVAIPDEKVGLEVTRVARQLNATAKIVTRCHYVSVGFEARAAGADEVVIAEQVVAEELRGLVSPLISISPRS